MIQKALARLHPAGAFVMAAAKHWRLIGVGLALSLLLAWGMRVDHLRAKYKAQVHTLTVTIVDMTDQALAKDKEWRALEKRWAGEAKKIRKERDDEVARVVATADQLRRELRDRPSRPAATGTPESAADGKEAAPGCTGDKLYGEGAGFLIGEAERADLIRVELKACYQSYDLIAGDE